MVVATSSGLQSIWYIEPLGVIISSDAGIIFIKNIQMNERYDFKLSIKLPYFAD
jgi:hypothetical protein